MMELLRNKIAIVGAIILSISLGLGFFLLAPKKTETTEQSKQTNEIEQVKPAAEESKCNEETSDDTSINFIPRCASAGIIGEPIIRDIDGDGFTEKVVRYGIFMADRLIEKLNIFRETNGEYKLVHQFVGDPYGFAMMTGDGYIAVGHYVPVNEQGRSWEDFDEAEITQYRWTKNGAFQLSKKIFKASTGAEVIKAEKDIYWYGPVCENESEMEKFKKPIQVTWLATFGGCLVSCEGASFTRVPEDEALKYPHFAGYFAKDVFKEEYLKEGLTLKISGKWTGIDADHPKLVFDNKCVPIVSIEKIEIIK